MAKYTLTQQLYHVLTMQQLRDILRAEIGMNDSRTNFMADLLIKDHMSNDSAQTFDVTGDLTQMDAKDAIAMGKWFAEYAEPERDYDGAPYVSDLCNYLASHGLIPVGSYVFTVSW